jgi:hypothetical protein
MVSKNNIPWAVFFLRLCITMPVKELLLFRQMSFTPQGPTHRAQAFTKVEVPGSL